MKKIFKNKKLLFFVIGFCGALVFSLLVSLSKQKPEEVHYHAGFRIIVNGKEQDFSDFKYMSVKPCTTDEEDTPHTEAEEQAEKLHLHDGNGIVAHVHKPGVLWKDLLTNLKITPQPTDEVYGYVNGQRIDAILVGSIREYDSAVIFIGEVADESEFLNREVTKAEIEKAESISESCGSSS